MKRLLFAASLVLGSMMTGATGSSAAATIDDSSEYLQVSSLSAGGSLVLGTWRGTFAGDDAGPGTAAFVQRLDESGDVVWTQRLAADLSCLRLETFDLTTRAERVRSLDMSYFLIWTCDGQQLVSVDADGVVAERTAGPDGGSFGVSTFAADPTGGVHLVARGAAFDASGQNPWTLFSYDENLEVEFATELPSELVDPRQFGVDNSGVLDDGDNGVDAETVQNLVASDGTAWVIGTVFGADGRGAMALLSFDATGALVTRIDHPGYGCLDVFGTPEPQLRALQTYGDQLWVAACKTVPLGGDRTQPFPIVAVDDSTGALLGEVALPEIDVGAPDFTNERRPVHFSGDGTLAVSTGYRGEVLWIISGELDDVTWEPVKLSVSSQVGPETLVSVDAAGASGYVAVGWSVDEVPQVDIDEPYVPPARSAVSAQREFPSLRAIDPERVLDTRLGSAAAQRVTGSVTEIDVAALDSFAVDARAVVVNLTVVRPATDGFATVYPCGIERPNVSSVNYVSGRTASNSVTSSLDASGKICVFTSSDAHLAVDVNAAFVATPSFGDIDPVRLADTRDGDVVGAGAVLRVPVAGVGGIADGAAQVVVNATAVRPTDRGYLTIWDCDAERPPIGSVNFERDETTPNQAIVSLGDTGEICVFTSVETHVLIDATAWLGPDAGMRVDDPIRVLDTRPNGVTFDGRADGSNGSAGRRSADDTWVLSMARLPVGRFDRVMSFNVAVANPAAAGHLTMWPCGSEGFAPIPPPDVSSVNFTPGRATSNSVVIKVPSTPWICFRATADYDLVLDLMTSR